MSRNIHPTTFVPPGFCVESAVDDGAVMVITMRHMGKSSSCPGCAATAERVHSRYLRRLADLPLGGRRVQLIVIARRFRCEAPSCLRVIFTERFSHDVLAPWARRTARLDDIVHCLGLALGGRPAANFARRLMMPVSNDTLLRVVRRRGCPPFPAPIVVGIDDWAWKRNQRYGTIICDLERRRPIRLLPDRESAAAQAWLAGQPQIAVVARDRGGGYSIAVAKALPSAMQVADRWHLMENASHAFLDAVRKSMRQIRAAIGAATVNLDLLTAAERLQYEGYLRREDANAAILSRAGSGASIKAIVRETGHSRGLVRRVVRGQRSDIFRTRESSLEPYLAWLDAQWMAGARNGCELWRRLKSQGFRGCLRVVSEWAGRRRRAEKVDAESLRRVPSARTIARLMTTGRDTLSKSETVTIAAIECGVAPLIEARTVIDAFHAIIRKRAENELGAWIERAQTSLVTSFANGVAKDKRAVGAAIASYWSNGQTEGQITKLKLVKRQMYGRAKIDLLEARFIGAN
jgi:transposase